MTNPTPSNRRWYHKKRSYAALVLATLMGCLVALVWQYKFRPNDLIQNVVKWSDVPLSLEKATWSDDGSLVLERIRMPAGDRDDTYLKVRKLTVKWHWYELLRKGRIALVEIDRPQIWLAQFNKATEKADAEKKGSEDSGGNNSKPGHWWIKTLKINEGTLTLDNLGPDIPAVPITVGHKVPLELHNVQISGNRVHGQNREDVATVNDLTITSPEDALSPVLHFDAINIRYTWEELRENHIRAVEVIGPTIYLGPDLFWYADHFASQRATSGGNAVPWQIDEFEVRAGKLAINAFGQPGITLPFTFVSDAKNIRLDQLDKISLNNKILIPPQDRFYPEYKVKWEGLQGEIAFSLPLGSGNAENVVNTVSVKSISWNDLEVTDGWSSVTFDRNGIYGRMEGNCYKGVLTTNFSIFFNTNFPWEGNFFALNVDSAPIAKKLAPSYLNLTGILQGSLAVNGESQDVLRSTGKLTLQPPGVLEIKSIDNLVQRLPADWNPIKKDLTTIVLEAFRTYNYTSGELNMDYQMPLSEVSLKLKGIQGERNFTIHWHQDGHKNERKSENSSNVANSEQDR